MRSALPCWPPPGPSPRRAERDGDTPAGPGCQPRVPRFAFVVVEVAFADFLFHMTFEVGVPLATLGLDQADAGEVESPGRGVRRFGAASPNRSRQTGMSPSLRPWFASVRSCQGNGEHQQVPSALPRDWWCDRWRPIQPRRTAQPRMGGREASPNRASGPVPAPSYGQRVPVNVALRGCREGSHARFLGEVRGLTPPTTGTSSGFGT